MDMSALLPNEILTEIFMYCLPQPFHPMQYTQPDITIAPMLLCQICSHWRSLALNTAQLWVNLSYISRVIFHTNNPCRSNNLCHTNNLCHPTNHGLRYTPFIMRTKNADFLAWWKARSRTQRLSLHLSIYGFFFMSTPFARTQIDKQRELFCDLLSSSQNLSLDITAGCQLKGWIEKEALSFPYLETLLPNSSSMIGALNRLTLISAPRLRHLHTTIRPTCVIQPSSHPLWNGLTWLCISRSSIHLNTYFALIRNLTALHSLSLEMDMQADDAVPVPSPLHTTLPKLKHMHIVFDGARTGRWVGDRIFENLHFPSLVALRINSHLLEKDLNDILDDVAPAIKELHIGDKTQ